MENKNCLKSAQIRSFFWILFSRIRTEYGDIRSMSPYSVRMREKLEKTRTRITPNTDSFYAIYFLKESVFFLGIIAKTHFYCKVNLSKLINFYLAWNIEKRNLATVSRKARPKSFKCLSRKPQKLISDVKTLWNK